MPDVESGQHGWSIGEVSRRTGLPVETLRFYDRSGLLGSIGRTPGGRRVFDAAALGLLDVVVRLRRTGMPADDVRRFIALVEVADRPGRIGLLREHRERVSQQLDQLGRDLAVIDWKIAAYTAAESNQPSPEPPPGWPEPGGDLPETDRFSTTPTDTPISPGAST
jgi:DNA-binding transcriptional MerR regulator